MRPVTRGSETSEEPIMYVFNNEDNQGFTVVAADKSKDPLIAVTELGSYIHGEPTGVEAFDAYMERVAKSIIIPTPTLPDIPLDPSPYYLLDTIRYERTSIGPLLKTKWGQSGVYARETIGGKIGCGPVAIAQIMAYHRHPRTLQLTYKNPSSTIILNWTNILKHSIGEGVNVGPFIMNYDCDCGCDYVSMAQLLREVGERAEINYGYDPDYGGVDVSMNREKARDVLRELGYNATKFVADFPDYQFYFTEMIADLQESRPVLIAGGDSTMDKGHIWVADGYYYIDSEIDYYKKNPNYNPSINNYEPKYIYDRTVITQKELVHFNWGWNGNCNGWFAIDYFVSDDADHYDDVNADNSYESNFGENTMLIYDILPSIHI